MTYSELNTHGLECAPKLPNGAAPKEHRLLFQDATGAPKESPREEPKKPPSREEIEQMIGESPDLCFLIKKKDGKSSLFDELWEGGELDERPKRQRALEKIFTQHAHSAERISAIYESLKGKGEKPSEKELSDAAGAMIAITDTELSLRRELADVILPELEKRRAALKKANAFKEPAMERALEEIENNLGLPRPDPTKRQTGQTRRNHFYTVWRGDVYPYFPNITKAQEYLAHLEQGIDRDKDTDGSTQQRIDLAKQSLATIAAENPIAEQQYRANQSRKAPLYATPLKLAALGIAAVAGALSLITVLRKLWKGEDLSASDWPLALWGGVIYGILKKRAGPYSERFLELSPKDRKELKRGMDVGIIVQHEPFRSIVLQKIGKDAAIAAVEELHSLMKESKGQQGKRSILAREISKGNITREFIIEDFTKDIADSKLRAALGKKEGEQGALTREERTEFLSTAFHRLQIWKPEQLEATTLALKDLK